MDAATLQKAMPGLTAAKAQAYLPGIEQAMIKCQITTVTRARHFLAQCGHESASLVYMEELASGAEYNGRADLGNTQPGDGPRFKGRGPIQVTGRNWYTKGKAALGIDLVNNPAQAALSPAAFLLTGYWWQANNMNSLCDQGTSSAVVLAVTRRINGGTNGLADRQSRFNATASLGNSILPAGCPTPVKPKSPPLPVAVDGHPNLSEGTLTVSEAWNTVAALQQAIGATPADGEFGPASAKKFQGHLGVTQDGQVGSGTIKAMQKKLGIAQDGAWGPGTTKALQTALNAKKF